MEKIKRVKRVPHLYERQYQTEAGERRVKFYAKFTCALKHKPRTMALGSDIQAAKEALALVLADNVKGRDFDAGAGSDGITFQSGAKITSIREWTRRGAPAGLTAISDLSRSSNRFSAA